MQAEHTLEWSEPVREFIGFVSLFLANGAIGFRFAAVRHRLTRPKEASERVIYHRAVRDAASRVLLGTVVQTGLLLLQLPQLAQRRHLTVSRLLMSQPQT